MELFHEGKELFDKFRVSPESHIIFSDYCTNLLFPYSDKIKFTSKAILFTYPKKGFEHIADDWIEVDTVDFHPWDNILSISDSEESFVPSDIQQPALTEWISTINDPVIDYPYVSVREGNIAFIFTGKPRSERSKGGKLDFKKKVESRKEQVARFYPQPFTGHVQMKIDIFSEDIHENERPDIDRLSTLITDAFQGVAYVNDKQIRDLRPRLIDVSQAFRRIECRTDPMDSFSLDDIPIGSVFPLAMGINNYYVVRILYYTS